jgi:hypothetical protein
MLVDKNPTVAVFLLAFLSTACVNGPRIFLDPAPAVDSVAATQIATSLFLIGDAGAAADDDAVLLELVRQGRAAPRNSTVVFLGDNVYPRGIPVDTAPTFESARRRLLRQASVADSTKLRLIFVPGNHDWDRHRVNGWAQVQRQGNLLRKYAAEKDLRVELLPRGGCPGPTVVQPTPQLRLIVIDTQWWLHSRVRPGFGDDAPDYYKSMPDPDYRCQVSNQEIFIDSLRAVHQRPSTGISVMIGHHPLESNGEHGGRHPWINYLFPLVPTPVSWLWLPIGWIYPLGRKLWSDPQDIHGAINKQMIRQVESTFTDQSPLIYAAGHEHSLEVIRRGPNRYYLVSGSGMEHHQSWVRYGDSTAYAIAHPGFIRVDVMRDRRVRLGVTTIDEMRKPVESYRAWLGTVRSGGRDVEP